MRSAAVENPTLRTRHSLQCAGPERLVLRSAPVRLEIYVSQARFVRMRRGLLCSGTLARRVRVRVNSRAARPHSPRAVLRVHQVESLAKDAMRVGRELGSFGGRVAPQTSSRSLAQDRRVAWTTHRGPPGYNVLWEHLRRRAPESALQSSSGLQ